MKKKITLAVLIAVVALGLTACTNTEVSSVGTTTTAKKTTTTTTAKKQEITTTTSPVIKITQSDVDKLVNELQEYSNSKSVWKEYYVESIFYGVKFNTYEEYCAYRVAKRTPSNSSWGETNRYNIYESLEERQAEQCLKDEIDYCYENYPNCHVVIYAEYFPDGFVWEGAQCTDYPCYVFWCLR